MRNKGISFLLKFIVPIYLLAILFLTVFRLIFVFLFYDDFLSLYQTTDQLYPILIKGFAKGFRYDNIVVAFVMSIPLIVTFISWGFDFKKIKLVQSFLMWYSILTFALVFTLSCVDFPYFSYFWTHPTGTVFNWLVFDGTFDMLLQESSYYVYYILYIAVLLVFILAIRQCLRWANTSDAKSKLSNTTQWALFILSLIVCFVGTRGHLSLKGLGLNPTYFTDNKLVSDLCVTPAYYFATHLDVYESDFSTFITEEDAISNVQQYLGIVANDSLSTQNPLNRKIVSDSTKTQQDCNIILVFMESLSYDLLFQKIDGKALTPFIDSLATASYFFDNIYSSGVHTNAGVGSTLISYPSEMNRHMMNRNPMTYQSILSQLKKNGYNTSFFLPNGEEYDNMGLFLRANYIDTIFSDKYYPSNERVNNFGVPDAYLFDFAIDQLSKISTDQKPFFSTILTVSNHPPYVVPDSYSKISPDKEIAILAYVDNSLKEFMNKAKAKDWYENTIFVFVADHGKLVGDRSSSMPLSYNHIPLIIYSPKFQNMPQRFNQYGGQIDILPTVIGLTNQAYENNTLGVDLLKETRPYMFFTSDTQIGCINDELFLIIDPIQHSENLSKRIDSVAIDRLQQEQMKDYAISMLATTQYLRENKAVEK